MAKASVFFEQFGRKRLFDYEQAAATSRRQNRLTRSKMRQGQYRRRRLLPACYRSITCVILRAIAADQRVGGDIVLELGIFRRFELRNDLLREHLAQLHSPLIE